MNSIVFPAPLDDKKYDLIRFKDEVLFVPKTGKKGVEHIPCLLQMSKKKPDTSKFLFYFHGNAEDIFNSTNNLDLIRSALPFNTVAIEYPGYSIYYHEKSAETIQNDSLIVFDYFVSKMGVDPKDITIIGRSIGSGPAIFLASNREPGSLILISPFISLRETAGSILGNFFKFMVAERFKNISIIENVTCPTLFIHGQKDNLISYSHSIELSKKIGGPYEVILPEDMDHNDFNIYEDFLDPISSFVKRHNILADTEKGNIIFPKEAFDIPDYLKGERELRQKDSISKFIRKIINI